MGYYRDRRHDDLGAGFEPLRLQREVERCARVGKRNRGAQSHIAGEGSFELRDFRGRLLRRETVLVRERRDVVPNVKPERVVDDCARDSQEVPQFSSEAV